MAASFWVALGGALGSVGRYWTGVWVARWMGEAFPWGTLLINVLGSFIIGITATLTVPDGALPASTNARLFVMAGICGGYTTFSAFSLQVLVLARSGEGGRALAYITASLAFGLGAVVLGYAIGARLGLPAR